jgi:hypothetical protein
VLVVKAVEECSGITTAIQELKNIRMKENSANVFATITRDMVRKWRKAVSENEDQPFVKRGRKVEEEFEAEVLSKIIFVGVDRAAGPDGSCGDLQVLANVAFSYDCVKGAAQQVQKADRWIHNQSVQNLTFSRGWITKFMGRFTLRRRVITNKDKPRPSQQEVQARMSEIQSDMDEHDAQRNFVFNGDETGVWYGVLPSHVYVPDGTHRGSAPASDDRARITAFLWADAEGTCCPPFVISKCSVHKADLSGTRVIQAISEQPGFKPEDGWELRMWENTFKVLVKRGKGKLREEIPQVMFYQFPFVPFSCCLSFFIS